MSITGASSGVGRAIAIEFALYGAQLVLGARREQALEEVAAECKSLGALAIAVPTDVRYTDDMQELAKAAYRFGGRVDIWINNAGVLAAGEFDLTPAEVHDERLVRTQAVAVKILCLFSIAANRGEQEVSRIARIGITD